MYIHGYAVVHGMHMHSFQNRHGSPPRAHTHSQHVTHTCTHTKTPTHTHTQAYTAICSVFMPQVLPPRAHCHTNALPQRAQTHAQTVSPLHSHMRLPASSVSFTKYLSCSRDTSMIRLCLPQLCLLILLATCAMPASTPGCCWMPGRYSCIVPPHTFRRAYPQESCLPPRRGQSHPQ